MLLRVGCGRFSTRVVWGASVGVLGLSLDHTGADCRVLDDSGFPLRADFMLLRSTPRFCSSLNFEKDEHANADMQSC